MSKLKSIFSAIFFRTLQLEAGEGRALLWSFSYFFALLCSYYILRPMRDEMGIQGGVDNLQWLFTGTLLVMTALIPLFGWITSRFPRRLFLPYVYLFFIASLLVFHLLMSSEFSLIYIARAFFIWVSVFNLFVVSVFWSFMSDIYSNNQARRLFGFIAAGGTVGAIAGPGLTAVLVEPLGVNNLLLISALFLSWALVCIWRLSSWSNSSRLSATETASEVTDDISLQGSIWAGLTTISRSPYLMGICLLMLLFTTLATFLYFMQAQIINDNFTDSSQRTALFASIDLVVNSLTLFFQIFITSRLVKWFGLGWLLAIIPLFLAAGFAALGLAPLLSVLIFVQIIRRAGNYSIMRPAREMLYVVLSREQKYKAKNVIDTVVYRAGDAVSAWVFAGMRSLGLGLSSIAFIAVPLALLWAWVGFNLGRKQQKLASHKSE
jgi:AAA family ATP:ADP antiporter